MVIFTIEMDSTEKDNILEPLMRNTINEAKSTSNRNGCNWREDEDIGQPYDQISHWIKFYHNLYLKPDRGNSAEKRVISIPKL